MGDMDEWWQSLSSADQESWINAHIGGPLLPEELVATLPQHRREGAEGERWVSVVSWSDLPEHPEGLGYNWQEEPEFHEFLEARSAEGLSDR